MPQIIPQPLLIKCEDCGAELEVKRRAKFSIVWPEGWCQCGLSRFGKQYDRTGAAWHCPKCCEPESD